MNFTRITINADQMTGVPCIRGLAEAPRSVAEQGIILHASE